jgi:hypothetical protein
VNLSSLPRGWANLSLAVFVLIGGCAVVDTNEISTSISFKTTSDLYDVPALDTNPSSISFDIASVIRNNGSESVHLTGCIVPNRPVLQKNVAGTWTTVYSVAEPECLSPPFVIEQGESLSDTLQVQTPLHANTSLGARWDNGIPIDGTYRLLRNIFSGESEFDLLDEKERVSESFEIRVFF